MLLLFQDGLTIFTTLVQGSLKLLRKTPYYPLFFRKFQCTNTDFENSVRLIGVEIGAEILIKYSLICLFYVGFYGLWFRFLKLKLWIEVQGLSNCKFGHWYSSSPHFKNLVRSHLKSKNSKFCINYSFMCLKYPEFYGT